MRYRTTFDDLFDVFNDFDELFRTAFPQSGTVTGAAGLLPSGRSTSLMPAGSREQALTGRRWLPAVESFVKDDSYHLRMELPGVDPKEVEINLTGDQLTVSGEKKTSREVDEKNLYFSESRYGRFQRTFRFPEGVKGEEVKAAYVNGVLELTIPIPEAVRPRTVKIEVATDPKKIKAA